MTHEPGSRAALVERLREESRKNRGHNCYAWRARNLCNAAADEIERLSARAVMPDREAVARIIADRFIERGKARITGTPYASYDEMPGSYRNDFLADADALIAAGLIAQPDCERMKP